MLSTMFILDNTSRAVIQSKFEIINDNSQLASKVEWNKMEKVDIYLNTHLCVYAKKTV